MIRHLAYLLPVKVAGPAPDLAFEDRLATVVVCRATFAETTLDPSRTTCAQCLRAHGDNDRARRRARLRDDVVRALAIAYWHGDGSDDEPPTVLYADTPARLPELEVPRGTTLENAFVMRRTALESERYRLRMLTTAQLAHAREAAKAVAS